MVKVLSTNLEDFVRAFDRMKSKVILKQQLQQQYNQGYDYQELHQAYLEYNSIDNVYVD